MTNNKYIDPLAGSNGLSFYKRQTVPTLLGVADILGLCPNLKTHQLC